MFRIPSRRSQARAFCPGSRIEKAVASCLLIVVVVLVAGCKSGTYSASNLPMELRVPPSTQGGNLDLSRLAAPKEGSSIIGHGDVLEITFVTGYEEEVVPPMKSRVSQAGTINLALVGPVPVAGLEPAEAEQTIARYCIDRGVYRRPQVTVTIERKRQNHVTVVGAVESPGVVELDRSRSDLLGALAMAGGLTETAGTEIQIMRKARPGEPSLAERPAGSAAVELASHSSAPGARISQRVDLVEVTEGTAAGDYRLGDGDVVMVYEEEPRFVYVTGLVNEAREVEIPAGHDLRVLGALAQAKGRRFQIADKVHVIRQLPHLTEPAVIEVSVREAKQNAAENLLLAPNDVVSVEETPVTFVFGAVQQLLRFGLSGSVPLF